MSKEFRRHESHKTKKLSNSWRKPRGLDNKVKHGYKGYVRKVKIGYGTPKSKPCVARISCAADIIGLKGMGKDKTCTVIFSAALGNKKKIELLKTAEASGVKIANVKQDFLERIAEVMKARKDAKASRQKASEEKKQKEGDKAALAQKKEEKLERKLSDEEKRELEKREKDKLLTKKEGM